LFPELIQSNKINLFCFPNFIITNHLRKTLIGLGKISTEFSYPGMILQAKNAGSGEYQHQMQGDPLFSGP